MICCLFVSVVGSFAAAQNVYIAQVATGGADGSSCANAYAIGFFNSSGNWGTGPAQIGPGTTVHLCGTITTMLTFQAGGILAIPSRCCSMSRRVRRSAYPTATTPASRLEITAISLLTVGHHAARPQPVHREIAGRESLKRRTTVQWRWQTSKSLRQSPREAASSYQRRNQEPADSEYVRPLGQHRIPRTEAGGGCGDFLSSRDVLLAAPMT